MTYVIQEGDKLYAQLVDPMEVKENETVWVGKSFEPLQGSVMRYDIKNFRNHRHILNPRVIKRTQEAFVVVRGSVCINIYHEKTKVLLGSLTAHDGQAIFVWDGFHEICFIEKDTVAYEIKSGQFTTVSDDKEFIDE